MDVKRMRQWSGALGPGLRRSEALSSLGPGPRAAGIVVVWCRRLRSRKRRLGASPAPAALLRPDRLLESW
ncbi:hypothetical protein MTO96_048574 [Rhipicephalus appendiculatus]